MITALDVETIPNLDMKPFLPEPKISKKLKDPAKIEAARIEGIKDQVDKMALDALTARICTVAFVGIKDGKPFSYVETIEEISDASETSLIQNIMRALGTDEMRLVTWNGIGFDLPMIYKRAMILGVDPANFGAPPLPTWTKKYSTDRHYDLMQIWGGWSSQGFAKLNTVSQMVLKETKEDIDVTDIINLIATPEGRDKVSKYCLQDTQLTWSLFEKFNGFLFV